MAMTKNTAADALLMLEERLARISLLVNGDREHASGIETTNAAPTSATARLRTLERALKALAARSYAVSDVLELHKQHPNLFHYVGAQHVPTTLPQASLVQLVLAHEQLYRSAARQLSALNENKDFPDPSSLTKLIALQPRMISLETRNTDQARQFADLRTRSARLVEQWYESGILDMGDRWADWEERLRDCEILVRRREAAKKREEGLL